MWKYVVFVCLSISWASAQNGRTSAHQEHSGHGWDIRLSVPGEPGSDYPTLGAIPRTSFSCAGKAPGYYADLETNCQVFRVCTLGSTYGFQSFLCPNGTLFNQAVFVCDWWMNVNCQASAQLFNNNNDKFGNLRLGPQLMKDIKKMLTHPMRNPYDKSAMKSNLVVMQEYKPPFGQLFPNGALIAGPERPPNNIYVPAKQVQGFSQNNFGGNDIAFAASTPDPRYIPAAFNSIPQREAEVFQRQRQNGQYVQSQRLQNTPTSLISNGHAGQFTQLTNNANLQSSRPTQSYNNGNAQYGQRQLSNTRTTPSITTQNAINTQRGQLNQLNSQYTYNQNPSRLNGGKQLPFGEPLINQQYNSNQDRQPYTYQQPSLQFSKEINGKVGNEAKQNLVSADNEIPSTVITKTLTLKRIIQEPKRGGPKSRITVKTWIVKPSKNAKLTNPAPYTYDKPAQPPAEKLVESTPYIYNKPTSQPEKLVTEIEQPYVYNKPTQSARLRTEAEQPYVYNKPTARLVTEAEQPYVYNKPTARLVTEAEQPYVYNKPTTAAKQIVSPSKEPSRSYLTPTTPRPTLSRLYLTPTSLPPTQASRLYLAPTTYNPSSRLYLPPSQSPAILERQYLPPPTLQQPGAYQSEQLRAAPTTPSPVYAIPNTQDRSNSPFPLTKQSQISDNDKNLTFTDILTKEKLDITVNDIVKDTSRFLNTESPAQFGEYRSDINIVDYIDDNYLPPEPSGTDSGENLTSQSPTSEVKSGRLVASPSTDLEPPVETFTTSNQNTNQISNLPFYKESLVPTNTIERTVSLKISIPEKIASYLFKNHSDSDYDHLEILNTGSSNYLVLSNNAESRKNGASFIPIGKLIADKPTNISNSQALVFSLLADSINVAKEYSNTAHQEQSAPLRSQFQNVNHEDLSEITNQISQLTSSQYSGNNLQHKPAKIVSAVQPTTGNQGYQYRSSGSSNLAQNQIQTIQRGQYNYGPAPPTNQQQFSRYQSGTSLPNTVQTNSKQVYSGQLYQLPVPDVTSQIYNQQSNANLVQTSNLQQQEKYSNQNNNVPNNNNNNRGPSADVEIIKSQSIPITSDKLQASPATELEDFNSQENFNKFKNSNNGISAQLKDKIVGTINHPLADNKYVTYKKDESYYVYTKLDNSFPQNIQNKGNLVQLNVNDGQKSAKLTQGNNLPNVVAFQFIPSVSYQLEDEKEQQKILNAFQIDEYGSPKQKAVLTSNVDYSVDHTPSAKLVDRQFNEVNNLYVGPSSYSAPQSSVGKLQARPDNVNSRLELEDSNNGYSKAIPSRQFNF